MSTQESIRVNQLVKDYRIYRSASDRLLEHVPFARKPRHEVYRALDGVSFEIEKGQTVGLIGPNGSGKSTLLEILCGTLQATSGNTQVNGRIAALLELGAGFNPEFSGRENVYLNASIMGIDKSFVDQKFNDVCDFADIGDYIERPVKTYSSGMYVRLAFAAAINMDPEILVVDEALSVGDIGFQRKCYRYFQELQRQGVTIIFVTHAMELIRSHCHKAIYIEKGRIKASGPPREVVHAYLNRTFSRDDKKTSAISEQGQFQDLCVEHKSYNENEYRWGNRCAEILNFRLFQGDTRMDIAQVERGSRVRLEMDVKAHQDMDQLIYGLTIKSVDGISVFGANTRARGLGGQTLNQLKAATVVFDFKVNLIAGDYFISLGIAQDDDSVDNLAIDRRYDIIHLCVTGGDQDFGIADLSLSIQV